MMKVIFLSINGVLISEHWYAKNHLNPVPGVMEIDLKYVRNLRKIVKRTGAVIVLSSAWRGKVRKDKNHPLHRILQEYGMEIYDYTGASRTEDSSGRAYEIQVWLDNHPDVTNIVILDSNNDMMHLEKYLVNTRFNTYDGSKTSKWWLEGLNRKKTKEAIKILKNPYVNIYGMRKSFSRNKF